MKWPISPGVCLLLAAAASARPAPGPEVRVERQGRGLAIEARAWGAGTPAAAMALLLDYESLAEYMPNVDSSYVVARTGNGAIVRQVISSRILLEWTFRFTLEFARAGAGELRFHRLEGSMGEYRGTWQVRPHPRGVEIAYRAYVETRLRLPFFLTAYVVRRQVERMMPVLLRQLQRRLRAEPAP